MSERHPQGRIAVGDARTAVWYDGVDEDYMRPLMRSVAAMLRKCGWRIWVPYEEHESADRHGRRFFQHWCSLFRRGEYRGLQVGLSVSGRVLKIEFWEDIIDHTADNRSGGRYIFDKESKMPYLARIRTLLNKHRIYRHLMRHYNCAWDHDYEYSVLGYRPTARERVERSIVKSGHYVEELGRARYTNGDSGRTSSDGVLLDDGMQVYARDYRGRWITGVLRYNLNNMWWVVSNERLAYNTACFNISVSAPPDLRVRLGTYDRKRRQEAHIKGALASKDYLRAHLIQQQMEAA